MPGVSGWDNKETGDELRRRATEAKRRKMRRTQEEYIELLRRGVRVTDAQKALDISHTRLYNWRKDKEFAHRCDSARIQGYDAANLEYDGSFATFRKHFFGLNSYPHHLQIVEALEHVQPREVILILIWPEAGKTTTVEDWMCKIIAENPNIRITDLSESQNLTRKTVGHVQSRMTDIRTFPEYINRFGPFHEEGRETGKPWTKDYFTVTKAQHDERDYTLEARAVRSKTYGTRIDILVIDDVISRETVNQSEETLKTIRQTYLTRGRKMATVIIGTRIQPGDLYEMMIEAELVDRLIEIPAETYDPESDTWRLTCPEQWVDDPASYSTPEELYDDASKLAKKIRHQVGEDVWQASYQQNPQAPGVATFGPYVDDVLDHERGIEIPSGSEFIVASLDPALGGGNALLVAVHEIDMLKLIDLDVSYGLARNEQILSIIETMAMRYRPQKLIVETNAFQRALVGDQRLRDIASSCGFSIYPHETGRNKLDNILGVGAMAGTFIRREISIPWGDEYARSRFQPLVTQLRAWRPTIPTKLLRQDTVVSLWFNHLVWMAMREAIGTDISTFDMQALPYKPTRALTAG